MVTMIFMGIVRIDDKLHKEIQEWIKKNGNKYNFPTVSTFVNQAIYKKLEETKYKKQVLK